MNYRHLSFLSRWAFEEILVFIESSSEDSSECWQTVKVTEYENRNHKKYTLVKKNLFDFLSLTLKQLPQTWLKSLVLSRWIRKCRKNLIAANQN